ncbi:hypothetical protein EG68_12347 [Paragonimus skrjabini miyazakii]|uniref:Membrane-bound transcription factor site-1 protease-like N-terminal domain-containing protein n=1 Tax=Paragonimus skrjabini miyazakii TaxID=59628 RepID=A0A8S9YD00_9TREM|nr:hypothetical protein EG68_12347 [Paragonimus skrjabini miyazakii]
MLGGCFVVFMFVWCCVVHKGFLGLEIKFDVDLIANEFIVTYHTHGLFEDRVLRLGNTLDSFYLNYTIQPRWGFSPHSYSSDFDVVLVHNLTSEHSEAFVASLQRQTGIKRVSQQKRIHRTLLFYDDERDDTFFGAQNVSGRKFCLFGKLWASSVPGTIPLHPSKQ